MSKSTKIWMIIAASLVLVGCIIFGGVMMVYQWDFTKLQTVRYETNTYDINENYKNISIVTDTADIEVVSCENEKHSVVCYEQNKVKHSAFVENGTLVIEVVDTRKWYEHLAITFGKAKITVYIPQGEYGLLSIKSCTGDIEIPKEFKFEGIDIAESTGDVTIHASSLNAAKIQTSTGNICVENVTVGALDLSVSTGGIKASNVVCKGETEIKVSTGKTKLTDLECKNLISSGSTGDITLDNVIATEKFSIKRSTGKVRFDGSDAGEIIVETDTGDVSGTLLSEKIFIAQTDTGKIDVPKTTNGGRCEVKTGTGHIKLKTK